jgi:hypothetical protein
MKPARMRVSRTGFVLGFAFAAIMGCKGDYPSDLLTAQSSLDGYVMVTSVTADPTTGPGLITLFDANGQFNKVVLDLYATGTNFSVGAEFIPPSTGLFAIEGVDSLMAIDLVSGVTQTVIHSGLNSGPLRQIARSTADGSIYVVESNAAQVEKFDSNFQRLGNPFVGATVGSCALATPFGIAYIPTTQRIAVVSSATSGRLSIYDRDGNCIQHITASPFNAGTPSGITYHSRSNKFVISRAGDHSLWAVNLDGTSPQQIYLNATIINTPRAITSDSQGYLYVSSSGTDTIEKLFYSGTGSASRVLSGPFLGPNIYTQNVSAIKVIEE